MDTEKNPGKSGIACPSCGQNMNTVGTQLSASLSTKWNCPHCNTPFRFEPNRFFIRWTLFTIWLGGCTWLIGKDDFVTASQWKALIVRFVAYAIGMYAISKWLPDKIEKDTTR
jgi:hypothetical protein